MCQVGHVIGAVCSVVSDEVVSNTNVSDVKVAVDASEAKVKSSSISSVLSADVPRSKCLIKVLTLFQRDLSKSECD